MLPLRENEEQSFDSFCVIRIGIISEAIILIYNVKYQQY